MFEIKLKIFLINGLKNINGQVVKIFFFGANNAYIHIPGKEKFFEIFIETETSFF